MSVKCIAAVLDRSQHAGTELLMLIVLADYSDEDGNSYPSVASLARKCRMQPRNANYILNALQASGELRVLKNEGPKGTNRYRIMLAQLGAKPLQRSAPLQAGAPLQRSAPTPAMECAKPLHSIADEPSLNRQEPSLPVARKTRSSKAKDEHPLFAEFYGAYPRKTARADAAKAFAALKPTMALVQEMLKAIKAQGLQERCADGDAQFVPYPGTWLRKRRWEDELPPVTAAARSQGSAVLHADHQFEDLPS